MNNHLSILDTCRVSLAALALATFVFTAPLTALAAPKDSLIVAADSLTISIQQVGHLKFRVSVAPPASGKTTVLIGNSVSKERLYYGTLPQQGQLAQIFDLSALADGTYFFDVRSGTQNRTHRFDIQTEITRVVLVAGK